MEAICTKVAAEALETTVAENSDSGRDRRRSVRHVVHTPAYASLSGSAQGAQLEFCEILNIADRGMCIQAAAPMAVNRLLPLVLDLSETRARIHTTGHVVWSDPSGRTGIRFPDMPKASRVEFERWLTANDQSAGGEASPSENPAAGPDSAAPATVPGRPVSASGYSSLVQEWAEIESDLASFGTDLEPALELIAQRALALTWASGAAIALTNKLKPSELVCRARAGADSPELGARLQAGAGFSGECVRAGKTLRCDDGMTDPRVDRKSCRALGIRSLIACPIKRRNQVIGILEVLSPEPAAFWDNDATVLERLARITAEVVGRTEYKQPEILAVDPREDEPESNLLVETLHALEDQALVRAPSSWLRRLFLVLTGTAAVTLTVWQMAPWIADSLTRFVSHSHPQAAAASPSDLLYSGMAINQLKDSALKRDPVAEYWLAMRYAGGEGITQNYHEAMAWFLKAADDGEVRAAAKMASCFWGGKGTPKDYSKAYFWGLLAQAAGDETGRVIVINSAPHLSDHQRFAEQQQADAWLRSHRLRPSQ